MKREVEVIIVGSGFAGLCMGIKLKQAGLDDFVILEKAHEVGGTWRENTYPGCACDVQSHLYSFSFEPNPGWTKMFAPQKEIFAYLKRCADKYGLRPHLRFGQELTSAELDETSATWRVRTAAGDEWIGKALVLGVGALHKPLIPKIPGLEKFRGRTFHSAEWDHSYPLEGKRVAVVGTGASAIQFVPQIAPRVASLSLFQRTPPWILPKPDREIGAAERALYAQFPSLQRLHRRKLYWQLEGRVLGLAVHPRLMTLAEKVARAHIAKQIRDPALREKVTPDYTLGCKRVLISDDYYPSLERDNVELITDTITEVREHEVVTADGRVREVDAILWGTGFHVTDAMAHLPLRGRDGRSIGEVWRGGVEAFLGLNVHGFPNLFILLGPNTGLGHNSMVFMIEAQAGLALEAIKLLASGEARAIDVRADVQEEFNREIQSKLGGAVWNSGCKSWYLDEHGVNRTLWPGFTWRYWLRTRRLERDAYRFDIPPPKKMVSG
jgi:cation diffusion facilitator CzcD-associated flavoprotein CzcO